MHLVGIGLTPSKPWPHAAGRGSWTPLPARRCGRRAGSSSLSSSGSTRRPSLANSTTAIEAFVSLTPLRHFLKPLALRFLGTVPIPWPHGHAQGHRTHNASPDGICPPVAQPRPQRTTLRCPITREQHPQHLRKWAHRIRSATTDAPSQAIFTPPHPSQAIWTFRHPSQAISKPPHPSQAISTPRHPSQTISTPRHRA